MAPDGNASRNIGRVLDAWMRVLSSGETDSSVIVHDAPTEFIQ
jgi:hypothetical protein